MTWSFGDYLDNAAEGLSTPGAWHVDRTSGVLRYRPLPGEELQDVIVPEVRQLVRLEGDGDRGEFVEHIVFRGLTFRYTAWELPEAGYHYPQAELPVCAALQATGARRCVFDGCEVYLGAPAVWVGQSGGNRIRHNEITWQFMWAVSLGWNWSYFPLHRSRDNLVEKNHVHNLGTGVLGTHGALYCLGVSPGTVLRNNYIHHVHAAEAWGAGEGTSAPGSGRGGL